MEEPSATWHRFTKRRLEVAELGCEGTTAIFLCRAGVMAVGGLISATEGNSTDSGWVWICVGKQESGGTGEIT